MSRIGPVYGQQPQQPQMMPAGGPVGQPKPMPKKPPQKRGSMGTTQHGMGNPHAKGPGSGLTNG